MRGATQILWLGLALAVVLLGYLAGPLGAGIGVGALAAVILVWALSQGGVSRSAPLRTGEAVAPSLAEQSAIPSLRNLVLLAVGIRVAGAFVFNLTGFNLAVAPDSVAYTIHGEHLAISWDQPHLELSAFRAGINPGSFYQNLNGLAYSVFGSRSGLALSLVNAGIGTLAAWIFARLATMLYGPQAMRPAFILCAFWPSLVLWTSINLRDAWSFLLLGLTLVAAQHLRERFSIRQLAILGLCLATYPFVRSYMLILVSGGIAASYLVVRARQLPAAVIVLAGLVLAVSTLEGPYALLGDLAVESKLETLQRLRSGLAYGSSAFEKGTVDLSTPAGALAYLPRGLANFLLAPFPWRIQSWRQIMALPETLAWYAVLGAAVAQAWYSTRTDLRTAASLIFVACSIVVAYALVEGNEGTAYRHRAHVLLLAFVLAAGYWTRRAARSTRLERSARPAAALSP